MSKSLTKQAVVIGAGPAGLTAAVELCRAGIPVAVLERDDLVGGIARTEEYKGYYFDIGGHRFFTKIGEVETFWRELLGDDFVVRPRVSRIYYQGKFFDYPLRPLNALSNLGFGASLAVALSYLASQISPYPHEDTFEEWVCNRFGKKLYSIFFRTYTEKVWGIPCSEIRAEWAAQRIKGLSLPVALKNALFGPRGEEQIKTLIEQFHYPRRGPGMMWQAARRYVEGRGSQVQLHTEVVRLCHDGRRVREVLALSVLQDGEVGRMQVSGTDFISTMPVSELVARLDPPAPPPVLAAAGGLTYRDFLTVVLILKQPDLFPDNWIYIHSPEVKVGRIQNFKNWSLEMVPDPGASSLGLEYFCSEGDELWRMSDAELLALGRKEIEQIGLGRAADVVDGTVVRQRKAYPVYNGTYASYLATIKDYLGDFENLQTVGRNGLHKYNNQDHSMLTAMLAVRNILGEHHDVWEVNTERSYHEEVRVPHDALSADEAGSVA